MNFKFSSLLMILIPSVKLYRLYLFFFEKNLEDINPFCGITDTLVFGPLLMPALGFKVRVNPLFVCFVGYLL